MLRYFKNFMLVRFVYDALVVYPAPFFITYLWNFGVLAGVFLVIQTITGIFLSMHYNASILAFVSVEHIMRDVNNGSLLRYFHANGAFFFFLIVYLHIYRNLFYASYLKPRHMTWIFGVIIFIVMILTAFLGYVLPWGQMSFWAATVITSLFSAIPGIGSIIVIWLWGGFAVDITTLNRFYSFHYLFPFVLFLLVLLHIAVLHETGSNSPTGLNYPYLDKITFNPYFTFKDLLSVLFFGFLFFYFVFFNPNVLGHPDNYIEANPLVTPAHIVPEWYFLPFYAILRSIPNKLGGVLALAASLLTLILLPFITDYRLAKAPYFRDSYCFLVVFFFGSWIAIGWIGSMPIEAPFYTIGQMLTSFFFFFFYVVLSLISLIEIRYLFFYKKPSWRQFFKGIPTVYFKLFVLVNTYYLGFMRVFFLSLILVIGLGGYYFCCDVWCQM